MSLRMQENPAGRSAPPQSLAEALQRISELEQALSSATAGTAGTAPIRPQQEGEPVAPESRAVQMLSAVAQAQKEYIAALDPRELFAGLLSNLLCLTSSEYGFIGEILHTPDGRPYLKTWAITNIAWNDETRRFYEENASKGLEFHNLQSLFGAVITSGQPLITNEPHSHPKRTGIPHGHPPLRAFMGLPFFFRDVLIGMVGVANRPGGYSDEVAQFLEPFLATCGGIINAYNTDRRRSEAEAALRESEARQRLLLAAMPDLMMRVSRDGRVLDYKAATQDLLGVEPARLTGRSLSEALPQVAEELMPKLRRAISEGAPLTEPLRLEPSPSLHGDPSARAGRSFEARILHSGPDEVLVIVSDITDRQHAEESARRSRLQEEIIRSQEALLSALSTPLIPISDEVVIMPIIGAVDARRSQQILDTLLTGVQAQRARVAILDITGVPMVDTMVAGALIAAARATRMLGAQVILTGIRAEVARALVQLGVDLGAIATRSSLQSGVAYAIRLTRGG